MLKIFLIYKLTQLFSMKKLQIYSIMILISLSFMFQSVSAVKINFNENLQVVQEKVMNREEVFIHVAEFSNGLIPESYKYIQLEYTDVQKGTELYEALQKLVYLDIIKNSQTRVFPKKNADQYTFLRL